MQALEELDEVCEKFIFSAFGQKVSVQMDCNARVMRQTQTCEAVKNESCCREALFETKRDDARTVISISFVFSFWGTQSDRCK